MGQIWTMEPGHLAHKAGSLVVGRVTAATALAAMAINPPVARSQVHKSDAPWAQDPAHREGYFMLFNWWCAREREWMDLSVLKDIQTEGAEA